MKQGQRPLAHISYAKTVFMHHNFTRSRGAEMIHAEHLAMRADITMPALRHAGFYRQFCANRGRQYRIAIGLWLLIEQLPAWHRNYPRLDVLRQQLLPRSDNQRHFRTAGNQDQIRFAVWRIGQNVSTAP